MALQNFNGTWTLAHEEYTRLKERAEWLTCLEAAGVDNWDGYEYAIRLRNEEDGDW